MIEHDQNSFLDYRRSQEQQHFAQVDSSDPMSSLLSVEINCSELCNRTCVFCPRHDATVYPNQNLNMSVDLAQRIGQQLAEFNYRGKISFSGYGENFLNKQFAEIVKVIRQQLPDNVIECNTNGDKITLAMAQAVYQAGLSKLYVNLYDGPEQREEFDKIFTEFPSDWYMYRRHWSPEDHGMILNNRGGIVTWVTQPAHPGRPCYYTSYKMMIDWNGNVLFCSNDWARNHIVGNLYHHSIKQIWLGPKLMDYRRRLGQGYRDFEPCKSCSVPGDLFGQQSYEVLMKSCE